MSITSKPITITARTLLALILAITTFGALSAPAGASPGGPPLPIDPPIILEELIVDLDELDIEPDDTPIWEVIPVEFDWIGPFFDPDVPSVNAEVNCETGTVDISVSNYTPAPWFVWLYVDDDSVKNGLIPSSGGSEEELVAVEENQSIHVLIKAAVFMTTEIDTLLDQEIKLDCLFPSPSYEVLSDCDLGQSHARLINHGDDTANIGVQYPDLPHMEIEIAAHSSEDWLLAVSPGESIDFDITSNDIAIGSEHLDFICEAAEEPAAAPVDQPVEPVEPDEAIEEPVAQEPAPVVPTQEPAAPTTVDQPTPVPTADTDIDTNDTADDELAAGSELLIGTDNSDSGMALGIVLIGIGLATLTAVALVATRRRAES